MFVTMLTLHHGSAQQAFEADPIEVGPKALLAAAELEPRLEDQLRRVAKLLPRQGSAVRSDPDEWIDRESLSSAWIDRVTSGPSGHSSQHTFVCPHTQIAHRPQRGAYCLSVDPGVRRYSLCRSIVFQKVASSIVDSGAADSSRGSRRHGLRNRDVDAITSSPTPRLGCRVQFSAERCSSPSVSSTVSPTC